MESVESTGTHRLIIAGKAWTEAPVIIRTGNFAAFFAFSKNSFSTLADAKKDTKDAGLAPDFVEPVKSQSANAGETVVFTGKVIGKPTPDIHWFRDTIEITAADSDRIEITATAAGVQKLTIKKVCADDMGEYRCE